jgi:hypothetical protein
MLNNTYIKLCNYTLSFESIFLCVYAYICIHADRKKYTEVLMVAFEW